MGRVIPSYLPAEERANVWTHAIGGGLALAGVLGAFFWIPHSTKIGIAGYWIYGACLVLMYLTSACYHGVSQQWHRAWLQRCDHGAIYLLIAGTYTPVMLQAVGGYLGMSILIAEWTLALAGIVLTILEKDEHPKTSLTLYITMGWLCLLALGRMVPGMGLKAFGFLLGGGVAYTLGVGFYVKERPFFHAVWHVFVLVGSILQFISVLMLP